MAKGKFRSVNRVLAVSMLAGSMLAQGCIGLREHIRGIEERPYQNYTQVANNQYIHYVRRGQGKPVILVHGFGGSVFEWKDVMIGLENNYEVYALDLPGFGDSDAVPGQTRVEDLAESFISFMNKNNIGTADAVFHSFSGDLGRRLKNQYPDRFGKIFLLDAYIPGYTRLNRGFQGHIAKWPVIGEFVLLGARFVVSEKRCREVPQKFSYDASRISIAQGRENWGNLQSGVDFKAFIDMARNYVPEENGEMCKDVVVVRGENDSFMETTNSDFGSYKVYVVPQCGHWAHIEKPDSLVEIIRNELGGSGN